jgi:DNA-binding protein WhiA
VCCKRAYLRGAFLAAGSVSDPGKSYHFEIVSMEKSYADYLRSLMAGFDLDAKVAVRKRSYIVYLKDGTGIVDMLNVIRKISLLQIVEFNLFMLCQLKK